jgi:hypothetical protein
MNMASVKTIKNLSGEVRKPSESFVKFYERHVRFSLLVARYQSSIRTLSFVQSAVWPLGETRSKLLVLQKTIPDQSKLLMQ